MSVLRTDVGRASSPTDGLKPVPHGVSIPSVVQRVAAMCPLGENRWSGGLEPAGDGLKAAAPRISARRSRAATTRKACARHDTRSAIEDGAPRPLTLSFCVNYVDINTST